MKKDIQLSAKMFFSSYGFTSPLVRRKFALVIPNGELLTGKTCVIIPYAGYDCEKTVEIERQGLIEFGFTPESIYAVDEILNLELFSPDYIYVPGGDPFKLLAQSRHLTSRIREWIMLGKALFIGVSAGAYFSTNNIEYITQVEDNNWLKDDFNALGLISENILCHYDHYSYSILKVCEEVGGRPIMTINDTQLLMYEDGDWKYIGE